jgi:hypothetical protein
LDRPRIAIAAGNPFHAANSTVESKLVELCTSTEGAYIAQHPAALIGLALGNQDITTEELDVVSERLGFSTTRDCRQWFSRYAYIFHDADVWLYFLRHFDAIIGARYHGVALGVQTGIPGVTIHIDNRTRELSDTTRIPALSVTEAAGLSPEEIADQCRWSDGVAQEFDDNRLFLAQLMVEFLDSNRLPPSDHLKALAGVRARDAGTF